jgi:hypothetical protein
MKWQGDAFSSQIGTGVDYGLQQCLKLNIRCHNYWVIAYSAIYYSVEANLYNMLTAFG